MMHFIGSKLKYTLPAVLFLCVSHLGHASPLCTTLVQTLAGYAGQTCTVGNVTFDFPTLTDGLYTFSNDPNNPPVPAADVAVTIVGTGTVPGAQVGFTFTPNVATPWIATDPDGSLCGAYFIPDGTCYNEADLTLGFSASTAAPLNLNSTTLTINPDIEYYGCPPNPNYAIENCPNFNSDGGDLIGAGEPVSGPSGGLGSINLTAIGNDDADSEFNGGTALTGLDRFNPVSAVGVTKDIFIQAFDTDSQTVLTSVTETFTYTALPEPGPFVLAAAGLGLLFLLRRRKAVLGLFGAMVLVAFSSNSANASPLCTSYNGDTLAFVESAAPCTIGDVTFTFNANSFVVNSSTGLRAGSAPTAAGILVNVVPGQLGFQFTVNAPVALVNGNEKLSFTVDYTAKSTAKDINGLFTMDTVSSAGDGTFTPGCNYPTGECTSPAINYPPTAPPAGDCPAWVNHSSLPTVSCAELENASNAELTYIDYQTKNSIGLTDSYLATRVAANAPVTVSSTFDMYSSGTTGANQAHLSVFDLGVTEIPEPLSLMLMGSGLVAMGLLGRRRRRLGRS